MIIYLKIYWQKKDWNNNQGSFYNIPDTQVILKITQSTYRDKLLLKYAKINGVYILVNLIIIIAEKIRISYKSKVITILKLVKT